MNTLKNATIADMLATNQSVGDRMPVFRDITSGNFFGIIEDSDDAPQLVSLTDAGVDGSILGAVATPNVYIGTADGVAGVLPAAGRVLTFIVGNTNTGAATLAVDGTAVLAIQTANGIALAAGDLVVGQTVTIIMGAAQAFYVLAGVNQGDGTIINRVTIPTAQVLALFATPRTLVPDVTAAAGTLAIEVISCMGQNNWGGTDFVVNAAGFTVQYITSNGTTGVTFTEAWGDASADLFGLSSAGETPVIVAIGQGVEFLAGTADPTTGDGFFVLDLHYRIHAFN